VFVVAAVANAPSESPFPQFAFPFFSGSHSPQPPAKAAAIVHGTPRRAVSLFVPFRYSSPLSVLARRGG
jgi:hypothetical protein